MTTPTPARVPGKAGRRSPKNAPALELGRLLTGKIPQHPASADYLAALGGGWQMLGNDQAGDCVAVTWANVRRLVTSTLTSSPAYPPQDQVWTLYKTQNPRFDPDGTADTNGPGSPADGGMDIQTLLEDLVAEGGPDGVKAVAFAKVNLRSPDEVKAAIALTGYVWTGITVAENNQQEFGAGEPWDYDKSSPVDGGHSVITGGYGAAGGARLHPGYEAPMTAIGHPADGTMSPPAKGSTVVPALGGDEKFITWAAETSFTDAFWKHCVEEAWIVIWPEHLGTREFQEGINLAVLAADYKAITGKDLPVPGGLAPGTAPVPEKDAATILSRVAGLIHEIAADGEREIGEAVAFLHAHGL